MPLKLSCPCGQKMIVEDSALGRKVRCPTCYQILSVGALPPSAPAGPTPASSSPSAPGTASGDFIITAPPPAAPPPKLSLDDPEELVEVEPGEEPEVLETLDAVAEPEVVELDYADEPEILDDEEESEKITAHPTGPRAVTDDYALSTRRRNDVERLNNELDTLEDDDKPRKRKKGKKSKKKLAKSQRQLTRLGLTFHQIRLFLFLAAVLLHMVGVAMGVGRNIAVLGQVLVLLGMLSRMIFVPVLGLVGSVLCCYVPPESKARPYAVVALILDSIPLVVGVVMILIGAIALGLSSGAAASDVATMSLVAIIIALVFSVAAWFLFMIFLRTLAIHYDDPGTVNEIGDVMFVYVGVNILGPASLLGMLFLLAAVPCIGVVVLLMASMMWGIYNLQLTFRVLNIVTVVKGMI